MVHCDPTQPLIGQEDVRLQYDATIEKEESHAGKVVLRYIQNINMIIIMIMEIMMMMIMIMIIIS